MILLIGDNVHEVQRNMFTP